MTAIPKVVDQASLLGHSLQSLTDEGELRHELGVLLPQGLRLCLALQQLCLKGSHPGPQALQLTLDLDSGVGTLLALLGEACGARGLARCDGDDGKGKERGDEGCLPGNAVIGLRRLQLEHFLRPCGGAVGMTGVGAASAGASAAKDVTGNTCVTNDGGGATVAPELLGALPDPPSLSTDPPSPPPELGGDSSFWRCLLVPRSPVPVETGGVSCNHTSSNDPQSYASEASIAHA